MLQPARLSVVKPLRRRWRNVYLELILFGLSCAVAGLLLLAASPTGTRHLLTVAQTLSLGHLKIRMVEGTLWRDLTLRDLEVHLSNFDLTVDRAHMVVEPTRLLHGELDLPRLELGQIDYRAREDGHHDEAPLRSLSLPLAVKVEALSVARFTFNQDVVISDIVARGASDGQSHHLVLQHVRTPWFEGAGDMRLDGEAPFKLGGEVTLDGQRADAQWHLGAFVAGDLSHMLIKAGGRGNPMGAAIFEVNGSVVLNALAKTPYGIVQSASVDTRAIDLHTLDARLPRTALDLHVIALPSGRHVDLQLTLRNGLPGNLPEQRLPLTEASAAIQLDNSQARIAHLTLRLPSGAIHIGGSASLRQLALKIDADHIGLQQFGGPALPLAAQLQLDGEPMLPHLIGRLDTTGIVAQLDTLIQAHGRDAQLQVKHLQLDSGEGRLEASGNLGLSGRGEYGVRGQVQHFNPAALGKLLMRKWPAASLDGDLLADGSLQPLSAQLALTVKDSTFNGEPMAGVVALSWQPAQLHGVHVDLGLGSNHLLASGAFGQPGDMLRVDASLPNLAELGSAFGGRLEAHLSLAGNFARPVLEGHAAAEGVHLPAGIVVAHATLAAHMDATPAHPEQSPLMLDLNADGVQAGVVSMSQLHARINGTQSSHHAEWSAIGQAGVQHFDAHAVADGTLEAAGWHGRIEQLDNHGDFPMHLNAALPLTVTAMGGALENLDLDVLGSLVRVRHGEWLQKRFVVDGEVQHFPLHELVERIPALHERINTDLILSARFDLHGDQVLGGNLLLERQSGDIALLADDPTVKPMALKLSQARVAVALTGQRGRLSIDLKSAAFGNASGYASSGFERGEQGWRLARGASLDGKLSAEMPALAWAGPLLGPTASVAGRLAAELSLSGEVGAPRWFGGVKLNDFALRLPDFGANWHDGVLEATLQGDTATLSTLVLKGGHGQVTAAGKMSLHDRGPEGALTVTFAHFGAVTLPERTLTVSGSTTLSMQNQALTLNGKLTADDGHIELIKSTAPVLGDDVVVHGAEQPLRPASKTTPLTLRLDLDLGNHFDFKGQGVDARLSGQLRVSASPLQRLAATGSVKVEEGRYEAYGQSLAISRGIVTFQGPIDNPALDIFAERKNLPIQVGVKISGTAREPRVALTADQALPDSEKLSWLVLGHGTTTAGSRNDSDVLLAAADALFSTGDSANIRHQLTSSLGLDEISVSRSTSVYTSPISGTDALPSSTLNNTGITSLGAITTNGNSAIPVAGRVVTLGKRLSDHVYVSYEQSLDGIGNAVKLSYQFTRNVSVALTAGQTNSIDLLYSWLFN